MDANMHKIVYCRPSFKLIKLPTSSFLCIMLRINHGIPRENKMDNELDPKEFETPTSLTPKIKKQTS